MPAAKSVASSANPVPRAVESAVSAKPGRIRLSKALAKMHNGGSPKKLQHRSSRYKIPDDEYEQLTALKSRVLALGMSVKRSELLRAGLMLLVALEDVPLKKTVMKVNSVSPTVPSNGPGKA